MQKNLEWFFIPGPKCNCLLKLGFLLDAGKCGIVSAVAEGKMASVSFGYISDACGLATGKLFEGLLE